MKVALATVKIKTANASKQAFEQTGLVEQGVDRWGRGGCRDDVRFCTLIIRNTLGCLQSYLFRLSSSGCERTFAGDKWCLMAANTQACLCIYSPMRVLHSKQTFLPTFHHSSSGEGHGWCGTDVITISFRNRPTLQTA